jgi:hypothetical protein
MTDAELLEEERKKKEAAAMEEVQPQAPVMDMSQENPDFGAMLRSSGIPDSNVVAQVPGIENVRNPGVFDPENIEPARPIMSAGTVERATPFELAGEKLAGAVEGLRGAVGTESVSIEDYRAKQAAQAATEASASQATPSVTPTIETPSGDAQGQVELPEPRGTFSTSPVSIDPSVTAPISAEEFAKLPVPEGTPAPVTIEGTNGIGYQKAPEGMVKAMAPDGRMVFASPEQANKMNQAYAAELSANTQAQKDFLASDAAKEMSNRQIRAVQNSTYSQESKAREARLAARPDFGDAVSDRERRAARGEGISMADRTAMAKASARGASPSEIARGNKIADELGVDLRTGQPRETEAEDTRTPEQIESDRLAIEAQELQNERTRQIIAEANEPDATPFAKKRGEWEERAQALREDGMSEKEISARRRAFLAGDTFDPLLFDEGGDEDSTEQSASDAGATPAASSDIITIKSQEEYDKLPRGAKYKDSTGQTATKK